MPLAVELAGVDFAYPHGPPVLQRVDLRVEAGEFLAIAGPNGGGKTTLLRLVLGLERPSEGSVRVFGRPAGKGGGRIGYLPQRSRLLGEAPDVDLMIRTGGEQRLSDFLLWESAYAELVFTPCMWPEFARENLESALLEFSRRHRRFGALPAPNGKTVIPADVL